jgi:F-type H+-transporting ATPase subunit epsilon
MATKKLHLKIVTPERVILEEDVDQVSLPTTEGEITILPGHIPLIATLKSGDIVAMTNGEYAPVAVVGGFIEVKDNEVAVLADFAEHVSELTDEAVEKAKAKAIELQKAKENGEVVDFEHFEAELERSLNRVRIADKWKTKKYRR